MSVLKLGSAAVAGSDEPLLVGHGMLHTVPVHSGLHQLHGHWHS